ncbi:MAG: N-6 DNA methylase [Candidatus Heimdallarchaeaceae archaeon]
MNINPTNQIISILEKFASKNGQFMSDVFEDFTNLVFYTLLNQKDQFYKKIEQLSKYNDEKDIVQLINAFKILNIATTEQRKDIIGEIYEALSLNYKGFGQFFTPHNVAEITAKMLMENEEKTDPTVLDPAVGSGRLLIAVHKLKPLGLFVGQDLDYICVKMCSINFYFLQIPGYIIWGDSLIVDVKAVYYSSPGQLVELSDSTLEQFKTNYTQALFLSQRQETVVGV